MPNLWTKAMQSINESISGPRTNDIELKKKFEEALEMDKALKNLKDVIAKFSSCFEQIMVYNRQISESIYILYDNNEEFKEFAWVLNKVHVDNNKLFNQINADIFELNDRIKEWPLYFSKVKELYEEREEKRKIYDHYEKKLEELMILKESKSKKGINCIGNRLTKKLKRNEDKYLKAKENYLEKCLVAYSTFENLLNDRFNLVNQPLLSLFYIEMKVYENFSSKYKSYKDLEQKLGTMKTNYASKDKKLQYDPTIFLKNPYLENKFNRKIQIVTDPDNIDKFNSASNSSIQEESKSDKSPVTKLEMIPKKVEFLVNNSTSLFHDAQEFQNFDNCFSNQKKEISSNDFMFENSYKNQKKTCDQNINNFFDFSEFNFNNNINTQTNDKNLNLFSNEVDQIKCNNERNLLDKRNYQVEQKISNQTQKNPFQPSKNFVSVDDYDEDSSVKLSYPGLISILDQCPYQSDNAKNNYNSNFNANPTNSLFSKTREIKVKNEVIKNYDINNFPSFSAYAQGRQKTTETFERKENDFEDFFKENKFNTKPDNNPKNLSVVDPFLGLY